MFNPYLNMTLAFRDVQTSLYLVLPKEGNVFSYKYGYNNHTKAIFKYFGTFITI